MFIKDFKFPGFTILLLLATAVLFVACEDDDDDDEPINEQEVITTVQVTFTNQATNQVATFAARDTDGDGGNPPLIDDIVLEERQTYNVSVEFLDESDPSDIEDITEEVMEEDLEHLVCYFTDGQVPAPSNLSQDSEGNTLGLTALLNTGNTGAGTFRVVLRHEPEKTSADPCDTGETDADVTFDVTIQ